MEQREQQQQQEKNPEQIREELHDQMMKVIKFDQNAKKVKELLVCGVRPNGCSTWGVSFINTACCVGDDVRNVEVVRVLLEAKASVNHRDQHGYTPLHYAADAGNFCIVQLLAQQDNVDFFARAQDRMPLHLAVRAGDARIVEFLKDKMLQNDSSLLLPYGAWVKFC